VYVYHVRYCIVSVNWSFLCAESQSILCFIWICFVITLLQDEGLGLMWRLLSIDVMGIKLPCPLTLATTLSQKVICYMNMCSHYCKPCQLWIFAFVHTFFDICQLWLSMFSVLDLPVVTVSRWSEIIRRMFMVNNFVSCDSQTSDTSAVVCSSIFQRRYNYTTHIEGSKIEVARGWSSHDQGSKPWLRVWVQSSQKLKTFRCAPVYCKHLVRTQKHLNALSKRIRYVLSVANSH